MIREEAGKNHSHNSGRVPTVDVVLHLTIKPVLQTPSAARGFEVPNTDFKFTACISFFISKVTREKLPLLT